MARIYTDGAEMQDTQFWSGTGGTITIGSSTPSPFGGAYYYELGTSGSLTKINADLSEAFFRCRLYFDTLPADVEYFPVFRSGGTNLIMLTVDGAYRLSVKLSSTPIAHSDYSIKADIWYLIEIHLKIADSPDGIFSVKVDGVTWIDYTGDTKYSTFSTFDNIYFQCSPLCVDDIALNDTSGISDNSWCGDGIIERIDPDGTGTDSDWDGSDGDAIDNYLLVDEFPTDDDTTYVYHDSSDSGTQDQYTMDDGYDGTDKTILRVYVEARARITAPTSNMLLLGFLASGGTDEMSEGMTLSIGDYTRVVGDEHTVNPVDSQPWEEADIDALETIVEVSSSSSTSSSSTSSSSSTTSSSSSTLIP